MKNEENAGVSADRIMEEGAVKLVSDKNEMRRSETEEKVKAAEKPAAAEGAKKPVKKKKIIIVTGGNAQGGQRGAYSSGSGAYNPGGSTASGSRQASAPRGQSKAGAAGSTGSNSGGRGGQQQRAAGGQGRDRAAAGGARGNRQGSGSGSSGRGRTQAQPVHKLIKPTIRQTQMEVDFHKPVQQPRRSEAAKKAEEAAALAAREQEVAALAAREQEAAAAAAAARALEAAKAETVKAPEGNVETGVTAVTDAARESQAVLSAADKAVEKESAQPAEAVSGAFGAEAAQAPAAEETSGKAGAAVDAGEGSVPGDSDTGRGQRQAAQAGQGRGQRQTGEARDARGGRGGRDGASRGASSQQGSGSRSARSDQPSKGQGAQRGGVSAAKDGSGSRDGRGQGAQRGAGPAKGVSNLKGAQKGGSSRKDGASRGGAGSMGSGRGDSEKRSGDKSRKQGYQDRDRRSKKDQIYNEDEKTRKNRSGRFIRPEKKEETPVEEQIKTISVPEKISIRDLAERMHLQAAEIIKKLFLQGRMMTPNSEVTYDEAEEIALGYEILCEKEQKVDVIEELLREDEENEDEMVTRPPVICVMGHVDHGKTSLLDAIRSTSVTSKEAGGITQAIGAYMVTVDGRDITFLDTPGHEAFTAMRMRGANSTDIAILVVAADDGVMPQTIEAISHAKAAGVEIIVAINKIDKDGANPERVKQELTEYDLVPTAWGGSTEFVEVSAKKGIGIEDLLETILLTADIMELKANPNRKARGLVLEAMLDKGRGPVANVLVQKGTLHIGDFISAGSASGKVRAMIDDKGRRVKEATPSHPVEILGLSDVPSAGEVFLAHDDLQTAKSYADTYKVQRKEELIEETRMRMNLDDLFSQMKEGTLKEFNIILKADVQGSVEALRQSLLKLTNEEVVVKVIHAAVGNITESDVSLASASNAVIIGFNVRPDMLAKSMADQEKVDIRLYKVIYQAIDAVEAALKGMRAPVYEERVIGHAQVRQLFKASRVGNIAGSMVIDGIVRRGCKVRITRGGEQIYEGSLASLKRFKDDVKEVREGFDCGLVFEGFDAMQVDDIVEAYDLVEIPRD